MHFRWEDSIKINFRETGCDGADWIQLFQDTVLCLHFVITVNDLSDPIKASHFLISWAATNFSRKIPYYGVSRSVGRSVSQSVSQLYLICVQLY